MDNLLSPANLYLYSGLLLGIITVFVPFLANLLQVVATWNNWRVTEEDKLRAEGGLVFSFHIAATVCSAIFAFRWLTQGFLGLSGTCG